MENPETRTIEQTEVATNNGKSRDSGNRVNQSGNQ